MNEQYQFGNIIINLRQGYKRANDYLIHWNGNHQFTDLTFFDELINEINNANDARSFIEQFMNCPNIQIDNCINTNFNEQTRINVFNYVNALQISDNLKKILFSSIIRCDIDNVNYECPRLNGCIRHFMQIVLLLGYNFDIDDYKGFMQLNIDNVSLPKLISDIGYPRNPYNIDNSNWRNAYIAFRNL